jgi:hypothetical protein
MELFFLFIIKGTVLRVKSSFATFCDGSLYDPAFAAESCKSGKMIFHVYTDIAEFIMQYCTAEILFTQMYFFD